MIQTTQERFLLARKTPLGQVWKYANRRHQLGKEGFCVQSRNTCPHQGQWGAFCHLQTSNTLRGHCPQQATRRALCIPLLCSQRPPRFQGSRGRLGTQRWAFGPSCPKGWQFAPLSRCRKGSFDLWQKSTPRQRPQALHR